MVYTEEQVRDIVRRAVEEYEKGTVLFTAKAGVISRHVILSRKDRELLFGEGYTMLAGVPLRQPHEHLYKETLNLAGSRTILFQTGILAGDSEQTQVVLTRSDMVNLGLDLDEYDREGRFSDAALTLTGPAGTIPAGSCIKCAERNVTLSEYTAKKLGLADGDFLSARAEGRRSLTFHNVRIKVGYYSTELHLDADEANGAGIHDGDLIEIGYF